MTDPTAARKLDIYTTAMNAVASSLFSVSASNQQPATSNLQRPLLFSASGSPLPLLPDSRYNYSRQASKRTGSMKNWVPRPLFSRDQEAREREAIVARSIELTQDDPNAAGVIDGFAITIAGAGLTPIPALDARALNMPKTDARALQTAQRAIYQRWYRYADATRRLSFGAIQYLCIRSLCEYGEYLLLVHMIKSPTRPYMLALRVVSPLRLKTPTDKTNDPSIRDGVELGEHSEPVAYWIKKSSQNGTGAGLPDTSANFLRIPAYSGHRPNVIHRFIARSPEQVRGIPILASSLKFFRDLNDYLDTELVTNIVASAIAYFIEAQPGSDPLQLARNLSSFTETGINEDGTPKTTRYEEISAGGVYYGNKGETPHLLSPNRPGTTFEPFTRTIKKAMAMGINVPYPVAFKDVEGVNFAGFRAAMLDAWRIFDTHRTWLGEDTCQPIYTMLQEEAYLRGEFDAPDFYSRIDGLTRADWRGAPKGDIEPVKAIQADALAIQKNVKTRAAAIAERGGDLLTTFDQLEEEQEMMEERGLTEEPLDPAAIGREDAPPDGTGPEGDKSNE